jgi:hypothetical protein
MQKSNCFADKQKAEVFELIRRKLHPLDCIVSFFTGVAFSFLFSRVIHFGNRGIYTFNFASGFGLL